MTDLFPQLKALSEKVESLKDRIETEESTKHAFVLPFIQTLGYDIHNPLEVIPEFTADYGLKKGEKVDYAIMQLEEPILIVECKHWAENLDKHGSQLSRYFHETKARFSLLTNGIIYRFYTDLEVSNKMDKRPFLELDLSNLKETHAREVEKFHKSTFDASKIIDNASNLKYTREVKKLIEEELANISPDFVKIFASRAYNGRLTAKVMDEFTEIVSKAFNQTISEKVNNRLSSALNSEQSQQKIEEELNQQSQEAKNSKIETTEEELEGYRIVVAILRRKIDVSRIAHRDTQSYFGILLDDNNRKPICRLHLNGGKKYIGLFNNDKTENKEPLDSIEDIYNFDQQLLDTITLYETE